MSYEWPHHERDRLIEESRYELFMEIDEQLTQAYAEGRKDEAEQHAWQPLETAPEDEQILLALRLGHHSIGWWTDEGDGRRWFHQGNPHPSLAPLAWMPLPKHPDATRGESV